MAKNDYDSGKASAVKFFMVIGCLASIVGGIAAIPSGNLTGGILMFVSLVWTIPMTVYTFRRLNSHEYIGTGFKVCVLIFHHFIAGIILLCMKTEGKQKKTDQISNDRSMRSDEGASSINGADVGVQENEGKPYLSATGDSSSDEAHDVSGTSDEKNMNENLYVGDMGNTPERKRETARIIFSRTLYRNYLIERGYSVVTPSGNPSTVDDYCHRIDFVCDVENIEWADLPNYIDRFLQEYGPGGIKQSLGAKSNNSVINALRRAYECMDHLKSEQRRPDDAPVRSQKHNAQTVSDDDPNDNALRNIELLKKLYDGGIITKEEYLEKVCKIIGDEHK